MPPEITGIKFLRNISRKTRCTNPLILPVGKQYRNNPTKLLFEKCSHFVTKEYFFHLFNTTSYMKHIVENLWSLFKGLFCHFDNLG